MDKQVYEHHVVVRHNTLSIFGKSTWRCQFNEHHDYSDCKQPQNSAVT